VKKPITREYSGAIPPTQLVDRSYSAYTGHWAGSQIPPTQLVDSSLDIYPPLGGSCL
jgi:hypothetical protein